MPFFLLFAIAVLGVFISYIPIIGFEAGKAHLLEFVIRPSKCAPLRTGAQILAARAGDASEVAYAQCVAVSNDRRSFSRGRVVLTTTSSIILFDPDSGQVWRVPTKDALIETVDSLDQATIPGGKQLPSKGSSFSTMPAYQEQIDRE